MVDRLTPKQYNTLEFIAQGNGKIWLTSELWRNSHHQHLLRRKFLRLRADPFKTKEPMLLGSITAKGKRAVRDATIAVRVKARIEADKDFDRYVRKMEQVRY